MKLAIVLVGLVALIHSNAAAPANACTGIVIDGRLQRAEVLMENVDSPYQLAIDRDTNYLFFSFTSKGNSTFDSIYINLKDKSKDYIPGIKGGFANAVDPKNQVVYMGGCDGIYKFDYSTKRAVNLDIVDKSIWQMFFRDGLYFSTYPDEKVYLYKDGVVNLLPALKGRKAMLVAFDKDDLVFSEGGELKKMVNWVPVSLGDYSVNAFNTDTYGNLYFSTAMGIYKLEKGGITTVASIDNIYGFAIEGPNSVIYASEDSIVRLTPTDIECAGWE